MPKRPKRKDAKPPPARRASASAPGRGRAPVVRTDRTLQYKVVELSTVDEASLERTLNEWSQKGWNLDGLQFAMRESSKRPAMAFVFFTREGPAAPELDTAPASPAFEAPADAEAGAAPYAPRVDAWTRLRQLAGEDD